jgi:class 3 adenylate cyclase
LFDDITAIEQVLQPTEREATICFFDLRGSSRLAEGMDIYAGQGAAAEHFALLEKIL